MKNLMVCVAALALTGTAEAGPATWCKAKTSVGEYDLKDLSSTDPVQVLAMLAKTACSSDAPVEAQRAQIDAARDAWGKKFGLRDADWADMLALNTGPSYSYKIDYSAKTLASRRVGSVRRDRARLYRQGRAPPASHCSPRCRTRSMRADADGPARGPRLREEDNVTDDSAFAKWAVCQDDYDESISAKYDEVRADTAHDGEARMWLRGYARTICRRGSRSSPTRKRRC